MRAPDERRARAQEIVRHDPDFKLDMFLWFFADTSNPYYAWQALDVCLKHKKEIPDWLAAYLEQCIERMEAKKPGGLREVLPWVFGFSKKAGPGNLLDPDRDGGDRMMLAILFAIEIEEGEKPSAALTIACNKVFDQRRAGEIKDKTLRSWLCDEFDLKKWPRTNAEWRSIAREHYRSMDTYFMERARRILGNNLGKTGT